LQLLRLLRLSREKSAEVWWSGVLVPHGIFGGLDVVKLKTV
jgi:hypothetical protein